MTPVRTPRTNLRLIGEGMDDLPATYINIDGNDCLLSVWKPTEEELIKIAAGGHVALIVLGQSHPPVILTVEEFVELGE